jgi:5-aminolevulinate synthase
LRITPSPNHGNDLIDALAAAMVDVWRQLDMPLLRQLVAE